MKRLLSILFCTALVCLCIFVLPPKAYAAEIIASGTCGAEGDGSNLTWTLDSEGVLTISGKGAMESKNSAYSHPWFKQQLGDSIKTIVVKSGVTHLGKYAFCSCKSLTKVTIANTVTSVGSSAFSGCSALTSVTLSKGLESIGGSAFYNCTALESITIPDGVSSIEKGVFKYCKSLKNIVIPDSVTSIEYEAFMYCYALQSITLPKSLTFIAGGAFWDCTALKSVYFTGDPPTFEPHLFHNVTGATAYYPKDNDAWTENYRKRFSFTWVPYCTHAHTQPVRSAVAPTCTSTGWTSGIKCFSCGKVLTAPIEISKLGHTEVVDTAVPPTCGTTGTTDGTHCSVCNAVLIAQETVPATGQHGYQLNQAVAATCTETGLTAGASCPNCTYIYIVQEIIPANGHTEVIDAAVPATCTSTGLTEGRHCSVCDEVFAAQEILPKLLHTPVIDEPTPPTCTEDGRDGTGMHCSACGETLVAQEVIPATGHSDEDNDNLCDNCGVSTLPPLEVYIEAGKLILTNAPSNLRIIVANYQEGRMISVQLFDSSDEIIISPIGDQTRVFFVLEDSFMPYREPLIV